MKTKLVNFLKSNTAESSGRLLSFSLVAAGILIAFGEIIFSVYQFAWCNQVVYEIHTVLILELIGAGAALKFGTKHIEKKSVPSEKTN